MEGKISLYKIQDFTNVGYFILMLGNACNMRCRHCAQMPVREGVRSISPEISPKVWELMDNYLRYFLSHPHERSSISFYGGEALLYWEVIKKVVITFTEKYDILNTDAFKSGNFLFRIQSNGLLLTQEKVDFINKYGIEFGFSYDAPHPFAVRGRVSDKICELVKKIDRHVIQFTCSNAYNFDLLLARRCLQAKFPNARRYRGTLNLSFSFDMPKDIYAYDWEAVRSSVKKLRMAAQHGDKFALSWFLTYFANMNRKYDKPAGIRVQSCLLENREISVTVDGRYSACQNGDYFFGTVDDTMEAINERIKNHIAGKVSPECENCIHKDICSAHCQLDIRNEDNSYVTCKRYWHPLFAILKEQIYELAKPLSDEDEKWYREEIKKMDTQIADFLQEGK